MDQESTKLVLGVDIGGSHISAALVRLADYSIVEGSMVKGEVDANQSSAAVIFDQWAKVLGAALTGVGTNRLTGIGVAMPGPFDYNKGISLITNQAKYEAIFGLEISAPLKERLKLPLTLPFLFENDASCFGLGEFLSGQAAGADRAIVVTLGTGFGATFLLNGAIVHTGPGVPPGGALYNLPFRQGVAEDYISARWMVRRYFELTGQSVEQVSAIADNAIRYNNPHALQVFEELGEALAECLVPFITAFQAKVLVLGGSIARSATLFLPAFKKAAALRQLPAIAICISLQTEQAAIIGAASLHNTSTTMTKQMPDTLYWRKTVQPLLPAYTGGSALPPARYNIYPFHSIQGSIHDGFHSLANALSNFPSVIIDGFTGNDFTYIRHRLTEAFAALELKVNWLNASDFLKDEAGIEDMVAPFLGAEEAVWGKKTTLRLEDFFQVEALKKCQPLPGCLNIIIGVGAALCGWDAPVVYIDLPKNELQYRMRAGTITNLGAVKPASATEMYKRFYFVDWVVLAAYRQQIKERILIIGDNQWLNHIAWIYHDDLRAGFKMLCRHPVRVRPWFDAGAWGGQWMKQQFPGLSQAEINYAWSFELIVPENGIVFESGGNLLEVCFDWLMEYGAPEVLGRDYKTFGLEFPIRFDFLDTMDGGNLSIQCHPTLAYIREQFGERITQDETYYILECKDHAQVYLGFQQDINPVSFRAALEHSFEKNKPIDITRFVQAHPVHKHQLFLIPNGTIHSSGANNLVLEISATPYIFTFKMYDWLRPDLNGKPRPINIEHGFNNLNFSRKGDKVQKELISHPYILQQGQNWQIVHLPTHAEHFYDVHRLEFADELLLDTEDQCHILMVVEGDAVEVETGDGHTTIFSYAETFVLPAQAKQYRLKNKGDKALKIIKAFVKK